MKLLDKWLERGSRKVAQNTSRRHLLTNLSKVMIGVAAVPLLPVARASEATGGYPGVGAQTSGLDGRMTPEPSPHQLAEPVPTVLGVRSGMNTQESTPGLVPRLKCRLLLIVQHITGGVHEDHHIEVL